MFEFLKDVYIKLFESGNVAGAVLGFLFPFALNGIYWFVKYLYRILPARIVFNDFRSFKEINFFLKYLVSPDGKFSIQTREMKMAVQNTPLVVGAADFSAVTDSLLLIGKYIKVKTINYYNAEHSPIKDTVPYICIGSSEKTYKILETNSCSPLYFKHTPGLSMFNREDDYNDIEDQGIGHGIIQKTKVKDSKIGVLLIMGMGVLGTSSSARYLAKNINTIGKMYGKKEFALLIGAEKSDINSGKAIHVYPKPQFWRKIIFLRSWLRISKNLKS